MTKGASGKCNWPTARTGTTRKHRCGWRIGGWTHHAVFKTPVVCVCIYIHIHGFICDYTSSTAQGGGGSVRIGNL